mgnify:CR=1 FL=1
MKKKWKNSRFFIDTATNVFLSGPPGVGKTHIATGLGHAAVTAGYRVYFTSAADLAARCHRAAIEGKWSTMMRFFAGPTLLIIDELGYLPLPGEAASALFQVINQRYLKTSIVITTNRPVGLTCQVMFDVSRSLKPICRSASLRSSEGMPVRSACASKV